MKTLEQYASVKNDRPGKFEFEPGLTNFLWDLSMNGEGEEISSQEDGCGHYAARFHLSGSEMEAFGVSEPEYVVVEDSQGFVMSFPFSKYAKWANL